MIMNAPPRVDDLVLNVPVLTADECARVLEAILERRSLWIPRRPGAYAFYTLGAASYLDSADYYEKAARFNAELERGFSWLYDRVLRVLGEALRCRVQLEPRAARPGFHIMPPTSEMTVPEGNRHFDAQFMRIAWEGDVDFSTPLSYTLAVRLPASGGGLNLWSISRPEYNGMDADSRARFNRDTPPEYVPYREGHLVCHSGLRLHAGAASYATERSQVRVTLQGHALRRDDHYFLYW